MSGSFQITGNRLDFVVAVGLPEARRRVFGVAVAVAVGFDLANCSPVTAPDRVHNWR